MNVFYLAYKILIQNFVQLCWVVVEICWNQVEISVSFHFPVWFLTDFFVFFYERVLLSLRNSRSEFCVAVLTQCGAILKLGGIVEILLFHFCVRFFIRFLWFLFMNMFYLAYKSARTPNPTCGNLYLRVQVWDLPCDEMCSAHIYCAAILYIYI